MTKRHLFVSFLLIAASYISAAAMHTEATANPTSVDFSWGSVDGAVYYDIYNGEDFIVRLPSEEQSYTVKNLPSSTAFRFAIAARTEDNSTLDASFVDIATTCWDGVYRWVNETDDDNGGKMKAYTVRVETGNDSKVGQFYSLYMIRDDGSELRIFPLFDFSDSASGDWIDYDDEGNAGTAYRVNAELFNTSPFNPGKWRMDKVVIDYDSTSAYIQTSVLGMVFDTVTTYTFFIEDGCRKMSLMTDGSGVVKSFLFDNPNPDAGDAFVLTRMDEEV